MIGTCLECSIGENFMYRNLAPIQPTLSTISIQPIFHSYPLDITAQVFYPLFVDDFSTAGTPAFQECTNNLSITPLFCEKLNAPVKFSTIESSTTYLAFLGIVIDT